jgi:acetyl-CoA acetyltransferase family protein
MNVEGVCIPVGAAWSSPFVRWQGSLADISSLDLAEQFTSRALAGGGVEWPFTQVVLGITIPQRESFFGTPTLSARLGLGHLSGPMVAQACATSVACIHTAAADQQASSDGARLVVTTDRTSNGPVLTYPRPVAPGGAPDVENWMFDNFERDPMTGKSMLTTAESVAAEGGIEKAEIDALAVRRYEQYLDAIADDRAFQRDWMIPVTAGTRRAPVEVEADEGVRPVVAEALAELKPIEEGGVISYGTQTHPADGAAALVVTTPAQAASLGVEGPLAHIRATGFARVEPARMPKAPVPAAQGALRDAGLNVSDVHVVKTHNPFAVNDIWLARELGLDAEEVNPYGCSLIYGHPQAPTGMRAIIEMIHALLRRGGGIGLFTGCAAGDTGAALVVEVDG